MNIRTKISAALAVAAISAAFMGYSTSANAASLMQQCQASTRAAVISCCQTWVNKHGKPIWMGGGASCSSSTVCRGSSGQVKTLIAFVTTPRCRLQTTPPDVKPGGDAPPSGRLQGNLG